MRRLHKLVPGLLALGLFAAASTALAGGALRGHLYFTNQTNTTDAAMKDVLWTAAGIPGSDGYLCPPASGGTTESLIPMVGAPAGGGNALILPGGFSNMVGMMSVTPGQNFFISGSIADVSMDCPGIRQAMAVGRIFSRRTSIHNAGVEEARFGSGGSASTNLGVISGGRNASASFATVYQYVPARDLWTKKANLASTWYYHAQDNHPTSGQHWGFGGIYAGKVTNRTVSYTPSSDTWGATTCSKQKPCPAARYGSEMVWDPVRTYFVTGPGVNASSPLKIACSTSKFDPATSTWTTLTLDLPGGACAGGSGGTYAFYGMAFYPKFVGPNDADGRVILWGGFNTATGLPSTNNAYMFNPSTNAWEAIEQGILMMDHMTGMETCDTTMRPQGRQGLTLAYNDGPGGATGQGATVILVGGDTSGWGGGGTIIRDTYVGNVVQGMGMPKLCWAPANQPGDIPPAVWEPGLLNEDASHTVLVGGNNGGPSSKVFRANN